MRRQYWLASPASPEYRYGFNGKENDDEVKGDDNQQDYGMRIYDPRAGRFLSVDPIAREYPELTPYQFASNSPIWAIDLDGLEAAKSTKKLTNVRQFLADNKGNKYATDKNLTTVIQATWKPLSLYIAPKNRVKDGSTDYALEGGYLQAKHYTDWHVIEVTDIDDAIAQVKKLSFHHNINQVIIDSHGKYLDPQFAIGSTTITNGTGPKLQEFAKYLGVDPKICLLACHAGGGDDSDNSDALLKNTAKTLNAQVYGSKSWTLAVKIFAGNPSGRNPAHPVGEQPNADVNVGKWKKATPNGNIIHLNDLDITIRGKIIEGESDTRN